MPGILSPKYTIVNAIHSYFGNNLLNHLCEAEKVEEFAGNYFPKVENAQSELAAFIDLCIDLFQQGVVSKDDILHKLNGTLLGLAKLEVDAQNVQNNQLSDLVAAQRAARAQNQQINSSLLRGNSENTEEDSARRVLSF